MHDRNLIRYFGQVSSRKLGVVSGGRGDDGSDIPGAGADIGASGPLQDSVTVTMPLPTAG
ncbi:MAG: hypothetical protein M3460_02245 [Actinomycetota bacterium]|nr:hypothetical protein [Actinomycetota bacterium]